MDAKYEVYQIHYNISAFFTIGYLAYLLSKLEPIHVHEIALTFIAIGSMLGGGVSLLSVLNYDKTDSIDQDDINI